MSATVLVLYYSRGGRTAALARAAARGVESAGATARLRTVPPVSATSEAVDPSIPTDGPPFAQIADLTETDGLLVGSPTRFGNMAAPRSISSIPRASCGCREPSSTSLPAYSPPPRPARRPRDHSAQHDAAAAASRHADRRSAVHRTRVVRDSMGGSPYGASHVATPWNTALSKDESDVAKALGARVARVAERMRTAQR